MLYLNALLLATYPLTFHLTLTNVVFESLIKILWSIYLQFNFNKCCIWIRAVNDEVERPLIFNFNKCCIWIDGTFLMLG